MTDIIPPGAFPEATKAEQEIATKTLSKTIKAFDSRRDSFIAMRNTVNADHERIAVIEGQLAKLPFPLRVRS